MEERGVTYLPGLEAVRTPLLLDERHVGGKVVVHLEVGTLLVDDCAVLSVSMPAFAEPFRLLTGGSGGHVCGCR